MEILTVDQRLPDPPGRLAGMRGGVEAAGADWLRRAALPIDARERLVDMQRARLALGVAAIPIEEAEGGIAGLLDLGHEHAAAHGMDGAGGQKQTITRPRLEVVKTLGNLAGSQR